MWKLRRGSFNVVTLIYVLKDTAFVKLFCKYGIVGLHSQCLSVASTSVSSSESPKSCFSSKLFSSTDASFVRASLRAPKHLKFSFILTDAGIRSLTAREEYCQKNLQLQAQA